MSRYWPDRKTYYRDAVGHALARLWLRLRRTTQPPSSESGMDQ